MKKIIAARLLEERMRLGLRKGEMASSGGIANSTYTNYEDGNRSPDGEFLSAISAAGVDVQYILTGIRSQQKNANPPPNNINLNKKKIDKLMETLTAEQQAELIKLAEEKQRMNWYEVELTELRKQVG